MLRDLMPTAGTISATRRQRRSTGYVCQGYASGGSCSGLTQQELAERIGATPQQTQRYEAGNQSDLAGRLFMLAQALDVVVGRISLMA